MKILYSEMHREHNPSHEIWDGAVVDYLETPSRAYAIVQTLKKRSLGEFQEPFEEPDSYIAETHDSRILDFLRENDRERMVRRNENPELILDSDESLSLSPRTYNAARSAVSSALSGASIIIRDSDRAVYSLCRPPGHHATRDRMGGFCFLNNAAIAAKRLLAQGRVAVLDIDLHHGNGTQDILYDVEGALYVSLNGEHVYPYILEGRQSPEINTDKIMNISVTPEMGDGDYLSLVDQSIDRIKSHRSDVIVVSAGFDTSENELPHLEEVRIGLSRRCYHRIGRKLRETRLPILVVQEGGYNIASLGEDVVAFLEGLSVE